MASVLKYVVDKKQLIKDIQIRCDLEESVQRIKFIHARKIQAWIRGILTRNHFRKLHKSANVIQCYWRRYKGKNLIIANMEQRRIRAAIKIQAAWRAYKSRMGEKNWLDNVRKKHEETIIQTQKAREEEENNLIRQMEIEAKPWVLFILLKIRYLRRTRLHPGIITKIDESYETTIEEMINSLRTYTEPYTCTCPKRNVNKLKTKYKTTNLNNVEILSQQFNVPE